MSAELRPIKPHSIESAWEAALKRMEEDEIVIRGLRKQNERLQAEAINKGLEASIAIAEAKFEAAQVGAAHRRIAQLEEEIAKLNEAFNTNAQIVTGLIDLPNQMEAVQKRVSYLMGACNV